MNAVERGIKHGYSSERAEDYPIEVRQRAKFDKTHPVV